MLDDFLNEIIGIKNYPPANIAITKGRQKRIEYELLYKYKLPVEVFRNATVWAVINIFATNHDMELEEAIGKIIFTLIENERNLMNQLMKKF
jgi:hypothetical protein